MPFCSVFKRLCEIGNIANFFFSQGISAFELYANEQKMVTAEDPQGQKDYLEGVMFDRHQGRVTFNQHKKL